ncbi:MAG: hypothetical protein U0163_04065 [Gemmatimonadaceae bacterium]
MERGAQGAAVSRGTGHANLAEYHLRCEANDLENINNLNHYIGMKRIIPESFELRMMPTIVGVLVVLGLAAAGVGRRWLARVWVGAFLALAVAGLVDFYKEWEHDWAQSRHGERHHQSAEG